MAEQLVFVFDEVWKPIPGYDGYEASDQGRIRSIDRQVWCGTHYRRWKGRILKPGTKEKGHKFVVVGQQENRNLHQLVMLAFVGPCPEGMEVCHNNGKAGDNRLTNLRYDTPEENRNDAKKHGTVPRGEKHSHAKLTESDVLAIRSSSESSTVLAARYGVHENYIWAVRNRVTWRWL